MEKSDAQYATEKLIQLQADYRVTVETDWGDGADGTWQNGKWSKEELDRLHNSIDLLATAMRGKDRFIQNLDGVTVRKADIGSHGGEARERLVTLSNKGTFSAWTVVHEFCHAWDANHGWKLSSQLQRHTGGFTNPLLSLFKRYLRFSDSGLFGEEQRPGGHGRRPGCNAAGYFYGDKPSGSNWAFNRVEDFAESVAMYVGWNGNNALSDHAHKRISRYLLANGEKDPLFGLEDHWADYAKYFYPEGGDYTKTKRWQFVEELVR